MLSSPACNRVRMAELARSPPGRSRSRRATRASGNWTLTASSKASVPNPEGTKALEEAVRVQFPEALVPSGFGTEALEEAVRVQGLGPEPGGDQTRSQAGRAVFRYLPSAAAMAASEQAVVFMEHPSHRTDRALHGLAAVATEEHRGVPLAVEKQESLLAGSQAGRSE